MIVPALMRNRKKIGATVAGTRPDYFTDLTAGPIGAPVTIYGENVNGPLVVGGVTMTSPVVNQVVYTVPQTGKTLYKTTGWLSGVPQGETTIQAGSSEILPFTVNSGTVTAITTPAQWKTAMINPSAGDIFVLDDFTYDLTTEDDINGGSHILWMRPDEHSGTETMPVGIIGHPERPPMLTVDGAANGDIALKIQSDYWTVSNLNFNCFYAAAGLVGAVRFVGNNVIAMTGSKRLSGVGSVYTEGTDKAGFIAGNIITGAASAWRLDHGIYLSGCPTTSGWLVESNYLHGNDYGRGAHISVNHQPPRCGVGVDNTTLFNHTIRNNTVDTTTARGNAIHAYTYGWAPAYNPNPPKRLLVEKNDFINCGWFGPGVDIHGDTREVEAIWANRGNINIDQNRFINSNEAILIGGGGAIIDSSDVLPSSVTNNLIHNTAGTGVEVDVIESQQPWMVVSGNTEGYFDPLA